MSKDIKLEFSRAFTASRKGVVVGIDECNYCTSMAGDCVVCACWLPLEKPSIRDIDDSKRLTHCQRLRLFAEIARCGQFTVVPVPAAATLRVGLKLARDRAMGFALWSLVKQLHEVPTTVLIDGPTDKRQLQTIWELCPIRLCDRDWCDTCDWCSAPDLRQVVNGDHKSYLIGAASIVAKIYVDTLFEGYNKFWPGYGLSTNHGAISKQHRECLRQNGPSPVHRTGYGRRFWSSILKRATSGHRRLRPVGCGDKR